MKKDIHPNYNTEANVACACGNTFKTGSTQSEIKTELCSACHPFYTGKQKLVDTARRVEKFQTKVANTTGAARSKTTKLAAKAEAKAKKS